MWRPVGWGRVNVVPLKDLEAGRVTSDHISLHTIDKESYEAGADAMLEMLKKAGKYIDASKYPYGLVLNQIPPIEKLTRDFKGFVLIIPDEEQRE